MLVLPVFSVKGRDYTLAGREEMWMMETVVDLAAESNLLLLITLQAATPL